MSNRPLPPRLRRTLRLTIAFSVTTAILSALLAQKAPARDAASSAETTSLSAPFAVSDFPR